LIPMIDVLAVNSILSDPVILILRSSERWAKRYPLGDARLLIRPAILVQRP
jgi:hypothetical protein